MKQSDHRDHVFERVLQEHALVFSWSPGLPDLYSLPPQTVIGTYVYTCVPEKRRWVDPDALVAPGVTHTDAARLWLRWRYTLPVRRRADQHAPGDLPLLVRPGVYADVVYIDIASAYRRVVEAWGFKVEYRRDKYLSRAVHEPLPDVIALNKRAYAAIVALSATRLKLLSVWDGTRVRTVSVPNVYWQPCLWSLTRDTLLGVYSDLFRRVPLLYYNTDGCIVRARYERRVLDVIHNWGLAARVKHRGDAEVRGIGSYSIGNYSTQKHSHSSQFATTPLPRHTVRWLRERVSRALG